jgi:sigma-E factor negative regulatory protein RseB
MSHLHQKVSALVDGELKGAARQRAINHIRKCEACRRELDETLALKARLSGLPDFEPSPDLFSALGNVSTGPVHHERSRSRSAAVARRLLVGAGSVSVVVLSIAYAVGGPDEPTTPQVAPPVDTLRAEFGGAAGDDLLSDAVVSSIRGDGNAPESKPEPTADAMKLQVAAAAPLVAAGDDKKALNILKRVARATRLFAFTGTRKVEAFDRGTPISQTLDVAHVPGQGTTIEVEHTQETAFLPDDEGATLRLDALVASYDVDVLEPSQVLGRPATVLGVGERGELVAKVWIDDETGLMLKRELYEHGQLVRASEYLSLDISHGDDMFLNHLGPELVTTKSNTLDPDDAARFSDAGWGCPESLGHGFQLTGLMQVDAGADVMHAEYTDGLSSVSVFSERGTLDPSRLGGFTVDERHSEPVYVRSGLPTMVVWESDSTVYAVVSDAPQDTVTSVVAALPHDAQAEPGIGGRVGTGLDRMAGFLTPLG